MLLSVLVADYIDKEASELDKKPKITQNDV